MKIELIIGRNDLHREVWWIYLDFKLPSRPRIVLHRYEVQSRTSKRHGWRADNAVSWSTYRDSKWFGGEKPTWGPEQQNALRAWLTEWVDHMDLENVS